MMKHNGLIQLGEERVYFVYTSTSQLITEESQDRNSNSRNLEVEVCLLVCAYSIQNLELRQVALPPVGWALPTENLPYKCYSQASLRQALLQVSFQMI